MEGIAPHPPASTDMAAAADCAFEEGFGFDEDVTLTARDWASNFWITLVDEEGESECECSMSGLTLLNALLRWVPKNSLLREPSYRRT